MSEAELIPAIEEFCSHATYIEEAGQRRSKLADLLFKTQKSLSTLLLDLLASRKYELVSKFLKKVNRYPEECASFLDSEKLSSVCVAVATVDNHEEMKVNFTQLFLNDTPTSGRALSGIITPAISWLASESLELSDSSSQVLTLLAGKGLSTAEEVVTQAMQQLEAVKDDSTKHLRYLCLLAGFMKISSGFFLLCEAKGATAAVIASVSCATSHKQIRLMF